MVLCVHVPQVGGILCTCTSGWWYCVYMYLRLVVLCVHVPQVGGIVCTCTSGWWYCVYMYLRLVVLCVHVFVCSIYSKDPLPVNRVYDHLYLYPLTKTIVHLL